MLCKVKGIGTIQIRMYDGLVRIFTKVRYIPFMKINLISLGTLERDGYEFIRKDRELNISKKSQVIIKSE